jgi:protein TonB
MSENRVINTALFISFTAHCMVLGVSGFNSPVSPEIKKPEEKKCIKVNFEINRPALLPRIETVGPEKKFKKVNPDPEQPQHEVKSVPSESAVVEQAARKRIEEKVEAIDSEKEAMLRYQDIVKQRIEQERMYPLWAKKQGIEGITRICFTVLRNGAGQSPRVIRSSGSGVLDEEALATVKRASPFPPVPKEISGSSVGMEVAIVFSLSKK